MNNPSNEIAGSIERVTFHSEETGFSVLQIKVKGRRELVTVVGKTIQAHPGEYIQAEGEWVNNKQFGLQFHAKETQLISPQTVDGMEKYLASGLIPGIGPGFAKRLIQAFGQQVFEVIENDPEKLSSLPGFGRKRQEKIVEAWEQQKKVRDIVVFLNAHGVGTARAVRIHKTYGDASIVKIKSDPYCLALDIRGIGFKTADALAKRLGIPQDSVLRVSAGIRHVLQAFASEGHCAAKVDILIEKLTTLLEIEVSLAESVLEAEIKKGGIIEEIINDEATIFLASFYQMEKGVAFELSRLLKHESLWEKSIDVKQSLTWVEKQTEIKLSPSQRQGLQVVLKSKVAVLTGGPGVGKTTIVNSIVKIIKTKTSKVLLAAPTGRAAKKLSQATGLEAKTLHRLLGYDPKEHGFFHHKDNPLKADYLVVDETSMVDLGMMFYLLKAVADHTCVLFVGDVDQLPSVGPGAVLANFIDSGIIPVVALKEIFRQAASSKIIVNAHKVNQGKFPLVKFSKEEKSDFYFVEAKTPEEIQEKLIQVVNYRIPKRFRFDPLKDIQVLVPMNRGGLGSRALNVLLQRQLNPNPEKSITRFGTTFAVNDKVIQTVNNYDKDVFNGDIGFIDSIDVEEDEIMIDFEGRKICYETSSLDELMLAYASTIHKAQGSEYPAVVIPIATSHYMMLERNLLYTGITRGKSLVVLIGQKKALHIAVNTLRSKDRLTHLTQRVRDICFA